MAFVRGLIPSLALALCLLAAPAVPSFGQGRQGPPSVAPVAEKLIDAVVNISTKQTLKGAEGSQLPKVPKGAPFEEFFDDFFSRKGGKSPDRKVTAQGSGFVIDGKEGLIVTNNHVIDGADEIVINFNDGTKLTVDKILGKDAKTDLALLKVSPKRPLAQVVLGSSARLKVGDWVMAIGNPFGLGGSVSVGIISAKQRDINTGPYDDFLQTDAAINRGNSGGPLFNMDGEVIGVNTAIIPMAQGICFATAIDTAKWVVTQLLQHGRVRRGYLGFAGANVPLGRRTVRYHTLPNERAVRVESLEPGGPAERAGLEAGDLIVAYDGAPVGGIDDLHRLLTAERIGTSTTVAVLRRSRRLELPIAAAERSRG